MSDNHPGDHNGLGHILPKKVYWTVFWALMVLTFITVLAAQFDFGSMNIIIAMFIASIKAGLVAMYFMHLKYENKLLWVYVTFPLFLLALLILGVFLDNPFRDVISF